MRELHVRISIQGSSCPLEKPSTRNLRFQKIILNWFVYSILGKRFEAKIYDTAGQVFFCN